MQYSLPVLSRINLEHISENMLDKYSICKKQNVGSHGQRYGTKACMLLNCIRCEVPPLDETLAQMNDEFILNILIYLALTIME